MDMVATRGGLGDRCSWRGVVDNERGDSPVVAIGAANLGAF